MGTLNKLKGVYAIRVGEFVELRSAWAVPVCHVSKLTKHREIKQSVYTADENNFWGGTYKVKTVKAPFVLKQTFFTGGTVLCYTKHLTFQKLFKKSVLVDKLVTLDEPSAKLILSPAWRRKNL